MTSRSRILPYVLFVLVLAVVVAGTWWGTHRQSTAPRASGVDAPASAADAVVDPVPPRQSVARGREFASPVEARNALRAAHEERNRRRAERTRFASNRFDATARKFAAEPIDPAWAGPQESRLLAAAKGSALAQAGIQPKGLKVQCHSSLCSIQGQFDDASDAQTWAQFYLASAGSAAARASSHVDRNPDGTVTATIYASN